MRKFVVLAVTLALSASAAFAQPATTGRSAIIQGGMTADETARLDIVRDDIQEQLNTFISSQRLIITQLENIINVEIASDMQELCELLFRTVNIPGAIFHVPVSVPAPGVNLPPDQLNTFCRNVMQIELPGGHNDPIVRPPFLRGTLPPNCNANNQDLIWTGTRWECVNTLSGRCTQPDANPPRWVRVTP